MRPPSSLSHLLCGARPTATSPSACSSCFILSSTVSPQGSRWASSKCGGSSSRYLQRQKNDVYVRQRTRPLDKHSKRKPLASGDLFEADGDLSMSSVNGSDGGGGKGGGGGGFVARSAFKLLQLDDRYRFLRPGRVIVDLGAAPGGWSQAIVERARKRTAGNAKRASTPVFALDLLPIVDIEGVTSIQGDFLDGNTQQKLRRMVKEAVHGSKGDQEDRTEDESDEGFVDVVVSDMMANTTGNPITDTEASLELCRAAASFAFDTLKPDLRNESPEGERKSPKSLASKSCVLVMKYFMSHEADVFRKEVLEKRFSFVKAEKMDASRKESREQFWICIGYKGRQ